MDSPFVGKKDLRVKCIFLMITKNVIIGQSFQFKFTHNFELQDHNVFMCVQKKNVFCYLYDSLRKPMLCTHDRLPSKYF